MNYKIVKFSNDLEDAAGCHFFFFFPQTVENLSSSDVS